MLGWFAAVSSVDRRPYPSPGRHGPRYDMALVDPCGGGYTRDCACGFRCPLQRTEEDAEAALADHIAAETEDDAA